MLLVKNSLHYVNIMTFDSILGMLLLKTGMFQRIENEINFTKFKHGVQWSHTQACSLKKGTRPYTYFVFKCLVLYFGIKKVQLEKKFEYFFNTFSSAA